MKKEIVTLYINHLEQKIQNLQAMIHSLAEDALNDAKSSAGDKHETGLAMMHLEQEKLNVKLSEALEQKEDLMRIEVDTKFQSIKHGTLVETDDYFFLVAIALPQITYQNKTVYGLSLSAPVVEKFSNLTIGSELKLGSKTQIIQNIF